MQLHAVAAMVTSLPETSSKRMSENPKPSLAAKTPRESVRRGIAMACLTASLWGVLPIALKVTLRHVDTSTVVWFRFAFAFVALSLVLRCTRPALLSGILKHPPPLGLLVGVVLGLNYYGFMSGIHLTTPGNAQILIQLGPMLLIVFGLIFFKERLQRRQWWGFAVAAVGFGLFYRDQLAHVFAASTLVEGNLWVVFGAVTWAAYAALQKHLVRTWQPQQLNVLIYGVPALMFLPLADFSVLGSMSVGLWALMIFLGLNTLVAYGALGEALKHAPASVVSIIITLNPLLTLLLMRVLAAMGVTWIAPESISWQGYLGAAIVLTGAVLVVAKTAAAKAEAGAEVHAGGALRAAP